MHSLGSWNVLSRNRAAVVVSITGVIIVILYWFKIPLDETPVCVCGS